MALRTLSGIRVLDLTAYVSGPYGATLLGDLGANRNKRGIVMDLEHPDARDVFRRMVAACDVVMHNFRPAAAARLGVDWDTPSAVNPRLVWCSLTGYGTTGPMADAPGFDQVLQCRSGIAHAQSAQAG